MRSIHWIDYAIVFAYCIGIIGAGVYFSRRASQSVDDYFLGGRKIPWYFLGISNASGMFDITGTMWLVMILYVYGVKSLWIPWIWPTFNQVFLMIFLAAWLRRSGVITGAQWLRTRFGSGSGLELAHISVVLFAVITVIAFIGYAFVGVGKFAATVLPWDLEAQTYGLILLGLTSVYVVIGGMYSVVVTDVVQFILLTTASVLIAGIAWGQTTVAEIATATPGNWDSLWFGWKLDLDWSQLMPQASRAIEEGGYEFFTPFLMMALAKGILASIAGPTPGYDMQRVLAAQNEREASLMSGIVSPILFVPRYLLITGICLLALTYFSSDLANQEKPDFEGLLPQVIQSFVPIGLTGILLAGLIAAFMSTFDSTVNAGAAYLVNDVYLRYVNRKATQQRLVRVSYVMSLAVVAVGLTIGLYLKSIDEHLKWIVGGLYGGYVGPNVLKWVWWRLNGAGYFAGMVTGVAMSLSLKVIQEPILKVVQDFAPGLYEIIHTAPALYFFPLLLVGSTVVSVVVSLLTPPDSLPVLKEFYRKVRPWGFWQPITRMIQEEDPGFVGNRDFIRDMVNCSLGVAWQLGLCAMPVFLLLRSWESFGVSCAVVVITSFALKVSWYDRQYGSKALDSKQTTQPVLQ